MIARISLILGLCIWWPSHAQACKPFHWSYGGGAKSTAEYAQILLKHATAIVVAQVVSAETAVRPGLGASSKAEVRVVERFKGPDDIRHIYSEGWGTCAAYKYAKGEERLFVLLGRSNTEKLHEVGAWQHPRFPQDELLAEFRKVMQPNVNVSLHNGPSCARYWNNTGTAFSARRSR